MRAQCLFVCLVAVGPTACRSVHEIDAATAEYAPRIPSAGDGTVDISGGAWRLIEVPAFDLPEIVRTPSGWFALSMRTLGEGKALRGMQTALYRSTDGVQWDLVPLEPGHDNLGLSGLGYGAGRYVMVGRRLGAQLGVIWSSSDAEDWTETPQDLDYVNLWRKVTFAGGRFFALGSWRTLGMSEDGTRWATTQITTVQARAVAYGDERYVLVGGGPMQVSVDGQSWQAHELDCALPGACITDPSGGVHQSHQSHILFAEGRFYSDQLSSPDGVRWQGHSGRYPHAHIDGRFLSSQGYTIRTWTGEGPIQELPVVRPTKAALAAQGRGFGKVGVLDPDSPIPEHVDARFEDGLTCETASCVLVGNHLYLIPPPGTPPLPVRVPRGADGQPLLSDECPVSSMIFCTDYDARTGCVCKQDAPRGPESCDDVSHYQCAGKFVPRPGEWQLAEVAHAGCSCDAVDPNQPPTFGDPCKQSGSACQSPLQCLPVETPFFGFPSPRRLICTAPCATDSDCPTWVATGFCSGAVNLRCEGGSCQPRSCR